MMPAAARALARLFGSHSGHRKLLPRIRKSRPTLEVLEDRTVLSTFVVNTTADTVDANPGDGLAQDSAGNTSLRAAIMEANALHGADTIQLPAGTYFLSIPGAN